MAARKVSARGAALEALEAVFAGGAYSNLALKQTLARHQLTQADKNLVTELVYGTVARKITLEWHLSRLIEDRNKLDAWLYTLLLLSLYQLLYLERVPAHAVVYEAAQLAKSRKKGSEKFVNAILRTIEREGVMDPQTIKRKNKRYSVMYSLPVWLIKALIAEYGEERGQAIFASLFHRSKASVRVTDLKRKEEIRQLLQAEDSLLAASALVKKRGHLAGHELFAQGAVTIQDESSQLVAPTLRIQGDEQILDACSAPGGKTCHMAACLTTGSVTALDLYDHKLKLIRDNAERLGVADKIRVKKLDAARVYEEFGSDAFDKILVDAPCSGMGLIRRKPDIRYRKEDQDFQTLQKIQLNILDSVCQSLRKGGIITYSTCTILSAENFDVIRIFLETHPNFEQVLLEHERKDIIKDGCILITPELYGSDGFFISQIRRVS